MHPLILLKEYNQNHQSYQPSPYVAVHSAAKEKPQQGTVVAAGPGKADEPMEVKVGDVVIYGKYAGTEVSVEGKDYLIMKQSDILAIL